jgi:adenine-specific DNA-methyltransferase
MTDTSRFKNIESWQSALGLLCVPLRDDVHDPQSYVLLNGISGNFCLDFAPPSDHLERRAAAWSSDVGHYVAVCEDTVMVHRWDRPSPGNRYSWRSVVKNIHAFHRYLEGDEPDRTKGIVNHVLRVFRTLRESLRERKAGTDSLEALVCLLACAASGVGRSNIDANEWGLSPRALEIASDMPLATWESLYSDLIGVGRYDVLRPDFELVLRHAAGALFQEAHIEASISQNLRLPGMETEAKLVANAKPETGVYFTPPAIARSLADEAIRVIWNDSLKDITIFDPACGSGELLRECLKLLKMRRYAGNVNVIGFDNSPSSIAMARVVLAFEKRYWDSSKLTIDLTQKDSLSSQWPSGVNILIMNPPFQSWQQMDEPTRDAIAPLLGKHLKNKPNLAMAFAILAIDAMDDDSVLAMVVPSSFLEGNSGRQVREKIAEKLNPVLIAKFGHQRAFFHALVDAGMYIGAARHLPHKDPAILWADPQPTSLSRALRGLRRWHGAEIEPLKEEGFSVYLKKDAAASGAPWVARSFDSWKCYEAAKKNPKVIAAKKIFDIKQGVRLGSDVFIVPKDTVNSWPETERSFFRPAVMNPSIVDGRLDDSYYVFYPYSAGLPKLESEDDLARNVGSYYITKLQPAKNRLASRGSLRREKSLNWWDLIWPRPWHEGNPSKIISKYFGGDRSFALDQTGEFVVVVGHAWLLLDMISASMLTTEELQFATLAYLNSGTAQSLLEYVSVQVSGGQVDLSAKYVCDLPVINCAKCEPALVGQLVECGKRIANGTIDRWSDVDDLVSYIVSEVDARR